MKRALLAVCLSGCAVASLQAGILQPGDIVFSEAGLDKVIRLNPTTLATNYIAAIDFTDATGGSAVGRNGDIYAMRTQLSSATSQFIRIDGQTGATNRISNETMILKGKRIKVSPDGLSLVVPGEIQGGVRGVFRVDLATGHQTIITTNLTDLPDFEQPWDIAFSPSGQIYVTDWNYNNLIRFNADGTGRHVICKGGLLQFASGVDVGADGTIYVASRNYHGIVRVDPDTGAQSTVTTNGFLLNPTDVTVSHDGTLIVADGVADVVVRVDPVTGQQALLYSGTPGPRSPSVFWPLPPSLKAQRSGTSVVVTWADAANAWQLQTSTAPADSNSWSDSNLTIDINGDQHAVTLQPTLAKLYFRLRKL